MFGVWELFLEIGSSVNQANIQLTTRLRLALNSCPSYFITIFSRCRFFFSSRDIIVLRYMFVFFLPKELGKAGFFCFCFLLCFLWC